MPVSQSSFKEFVLLFMWEGSLVLTAISLMLTVVMTFRHFRKEKEGRRRAEKKEQVARSMNAHLDPSKDVEAHNLKKPDDVDISIAIEIANDWLRNLSGQRAEQIVTLLRGWGSEEYLDKTLAKGNKTARIHSLIYCAHDSNTKTLRHLTEHSSEKTHVIQAICLRGLAKRGETDALREVLEKIDMSEFRSTLMLADVFMHLGHSGIPFLVAVMNKTEASIEMRQAALMAIGHIGSLDAVGPLLAFCERGDLPTDLRAQALLVLGNIGDYRAEATILAALHDPDTIIRVNAIQAAARLKCASFISQLTELLGDNAWWVRYRAAEALIKSGNGGISALKATSQGKSKAAKFASDVLIEHKIGNA